VRILVVSSYPPRHCGVGAYARGQVAALREAGHAVTVLSPPDGTGDLKVPFFRGRPFFRAARLARRFDRAIVHFQPGLYYRRGAPVSKVLASFGLLWLALRAGRRLDLLVHEADPPTLWRPDYALLRLAFARAGRVSFHTEAEHRDLERQYRVRVRASVVPHRVEARATPRQEARARLGLSDDAGPLFVCPGFIQPSKGLDRAVDAFASREHDRGRLYIVGSVREPTPELERYARDLEERSRTVPGVTVFERFLADEEFDLWVSAADWVVLPYRRSWSSGVLARAQALGRPAIVTDVGGLAEQAGDGDIVVRDDEELAEAMRTAAGAVGMVGPRRAAPRDGRGGDVYGDAGDARAETANVVTTQGGKGMLLGLILISVGLAALAQLTLKHGMNQVTHGGATPLDVGQPLDTARRIAANLSVWLGLGTFVISAAVWLIVLSRASLSFAYPFVSLTYVLILLFDRFVLHEPISGVRYGGVALIIAGILLISRTHSIA
jgi:glycosyltransferase involved in cell wall biosynthesis/multidrug transporter EmrE-like cation transporter